MLLSAKEPKSYLTKYACNDRIHLFVHSSETCQYNSNVLTLVAATYYVAGLFDVKCVDQDYKSTTNMFACGTLKMKDPMLQLFLLHCNEIAK